MSLGEQKRDVLAQISIVESRISGGREQKKLLESSIPSTDSGGFGGIVIVVVGLACIAAMIVIFSSETMSGSEKGLVVGIGLMVVAGIGERIGNSLSESREDRIRSEHADTFSQIYEIERQEKIYNETLQELTDKYNEIIRLQRSWWTALDGWSFEKEVARVFQLCGYRAVTTRGSNDGGVDINLYKDGKRIIVQCKNHKAAIGPSPIRDLFGVLTSTRADGAIMVSRTTYTSGARQYADENGVKLMIVDDIIEMQKQT